MRTVLVRSLAVWTLAVPSPTQLIRLPKTRDVFKRTSRERRGREDHPDLRRSRSCR